MLFLNALIIISLIFSTLPINLNSTAWKNGQSADEFSSNPKNPNYGTHDWIAEHALDWLPLEEKSYILKNLDTYLYGTELPDRTTGSDAIGDMDLQHFYFDDYGNMKDKSAGIRTAQEYFRTVKYLENGDLYNGTLHLGIMTHYIADLAVFGNVMNETYWGKPTHYKDYMDYVNLKMPSYTSIDFDKYLKFDGKFFTLPPEDAAIAVAFNTTFDTIGIDRRAGVPNAGRENCTWMDENYDWSDPVFKARCGESLNYAVNLITDLLHTLYVENLSYPEAPKKLRVIGKSGNAINLAWNANTEKSLAGYAIYINVSDSSTQFNPIPINISKKYTSYSYTGLKDEVKYYFMIKAYNYFDKFSSDSNIVSTTTLDITPPPKPTVTKLPAVTTKSKIIINGLSEEKGAKIEIYINDFITPAYTNISDPLSGIYRVEIDLALGINNITVRAVDKVGNPSEFTKHQIIIYDPITPIAKAGKDIEIGMAKEPIKIDFNGSESTDNNHIIANYTWTVIYQNNFIYLYGPIQSFVFNKAGEYRVWLNVTDLAGNWDTDYVWVNITQLDIEPPYVTHYYPTDGEQNVTVNVTIKVKFSEPLNTSTLKVRLVSNIEGELQIPRPAYDPLGFMTLEPFSNLSYDRIYNVIINAKDLNGNGLLGGSWSFSTQPRPLDFDADQIPDSWEWKYGLDANLSNANDDPDHDELTNFEEFNYGRNSTNPLLWDTDGDGMSDYFERLFLLNPLDPTDRDLDFDEDGKTNYEEFLGPDGKWDNKDWTNPNEKPEPKKKSEKDRQVDYSLIIVAFLIVLLFLLILGSIARRMRYKETGVKKVEDDDYLETKDPDELGIGGDILLEDSNNYSNMKKSSEPETERSINIDRIAAVRSSAGKSVPGKATPEEILARAKLKEKKCPECGAGLPLDTTYCFECGATLDKKPK